MKNKTTQISIAVVLVLVSFYCGIKYGQSQTPARQSGSFGQNVGQNGRGFRIMNGGGAISGEILSIDSSSITVKSRDGNSRIVLISPSVQVSKSVSGSMSDLIVGKEVNAIGTTNSDGSITAQSVQIRPASSTMPMRQ